MAAQSSLLYARNVLNLVDELTPEDQGVIKLDMADEMLRGATILNGGEITWPPPSAAPAPAAKPAPPAAEPQESPDMPVKAKGLNDGVKSVFTMVVGGAILYGIGSYAPASFMVHFTIFVLSCFVGWQVIWNVAPALHTPLMSVTNAISGIVVLGPLLMVSDPSLIVVILAAIAIVFATINIAGGFVVTQRMLQMFKRS